MSETHGKDLDVLLEDILDADLDATRGRVPVNVLLKIQTLRELKLLQKFVLELGRDH